MQESSAGTGSGDHQRLAWCCGYTPEEIIAAAGFLPHRLLGAPYPWTRAGAFLPADFCSYAVSLLEAALEEGHNLAGAIIANSCHPMLHLYNVWRQNRPPAFLYLLEVPRQAGEAAVAFFAANLRRLWQALKDEFGLRRSEDDLWEAVALYQHTREMLARLYALGACDPPPLTGQQVAEVMALAARSSKVLFNKWLADRLVFWEEAGQQGRVIVDLPLPGTTSAPAVGAARPRCLVSGSMVPPGLIGLLEELGVAVVVDDLCTGGRYLATPEEKGPGDLEPDPFKYLARLYLNRPPCPRMREANRRWERLVSLAQRYRVSGVIFYTLKFCDYYHYAFPPLRRRLQEKGIPILRLEGEYSLGGAGQLRTRVQAFLETIVTGLEVAR